MIPYHLRSSSGGSSDFEDKGIAGSFKFGSALDIRKDKDTLSCQQALTDFIASGTMTDLALWTIPADDNNVYFFCRDGKIFRTTQAGSTVLVYTDSGGAILGAAQWYDNAGFTYLFWATATKLHLKKILGTSYSNTEPWNDVDTASTGTWPKTNLTSALWHTMKICNGDLVICNDSWLAFVGYDLSYSNQALQLIPGNHSKTLVERGIYAITGTNRTGVVEECSLYAWDGIALNYNQKQIMKVSSINSMIDTEVALMQVGSEGQLYLSNLNAPMPIYSFRGGGQTMPDGVTSDRGMALFGIYGNSNGNNGIYSYGRIKKNANIVPNFDYPLDCDEIGSICKANGTIYITYRKGTNYGVKMVDNNNKAQAIYQSLDLIAPLGTRRYPVPLGRMLDWAWADLFFAPLPAGCGIEVWYRLDKVTNETSLNLNADSNGWVQANLMDQPNTFRLETTGSQQAIWAINEKSRVLEAQVVLIPNGNNTPEVHEINLYFNMG